MTDEKMIEEMAKDLIRATGMQVNDRAKYLYDLRYRKITEKAVVLTREEYARLKQYEKKIRGGVYFTKKGWNDYIDNKDSNHRTILLAQVRKETVREFAKDLLQELDLVGYDKSDFCVTAVEVVAKQYGVKVEEL